MRAKTESFVNFLDPRSVEEVLQTNDTAVAPFLARYAVPRGKGQPLPGGYDPHRSLWVVPGDQGPVPLVEAGQALRELETKTKVDNEQDDTASHVMGLSGTTVTSVGGEQDDAALVTLLSATITEVKTEADDLT